MRLNVSYPANEINKMKKKRRRFRLFSSLFNFQCGIKQKYMQLKKLFSLQQHAVNLWNLMRVQIFAILFYDISDILPNSDMLFAISSKTFFCLVEFCLPKSQAKKISPSQTSFCVRFFKFPSKQKNRREEKKQFYNLGRYMCALAVWGEKVQRTISRLFEYEKIVLFKYMQYSCCCWCCECEPNNSFSPIRSARYFLYFRFYFLFSFSPCVIPRVCCLQEASANLNSQRHKLHLYNCYMHKERKHKSKNFWFTFLGVEKFFRKNVRSF